MTVQDNIKNRSKIEESFLSVCSVCNSEHLKNCGCQNALVLKKLEEYKKERKEELFARWYKDVEGKMPEKEIKAYLEGIWISWAPRFMQEAVRLAGQECEANQVRCKLEEKIIQDVLVIFSARYDLTDPRVYMVVRSILQHQLSSWRMQRYSSGNDLIIEWEDRQGNTHKSLSPVEDVKRKFDDSIIKAVETLDKMIDGSKISMESKVTVATILQKIEEDSVDQIGVLDNVLDRN